MGTYRELPVIAAPSQRLSTVLAGKRCDLTINYNAWSDRWSLDVEIEGEMKLAGRRIVMATDLLAAPDLGIGKLVAVDWRGTGEQPGRSELPSGAVRLIHYDETGVAA